MSKDIFTIEKGRFLMWLSFFIYVYLCSKYYQFFTSQGFSYGDYYDTFTYVINGDFRKLNINTINRLDQGMAVNFFFEGNGLAYLYYYLPRSENLGFGLTSLIVNITCFSLAFIFLQKINKKLKIDNKWLYLFFLNPQLIFYSQTINKEPFTLFFTFLSIYLLLEKKYFYLIIVAFIFGSIREHHLVFLVLLIYLYNSKTLKSFSLRLFISYIFMGIISIFYFSASYDPSNLNFAGKFSNLIGILDQYGIGYFLIAPIRIMQNFYDQFYQSFFFILPAYSYVSDGSLYYAKEGLISIYKLKELLPNILLLFFILIQMLTFKIKFNWFFGPQKIYYIAIICFILVVSVSPVVHSRYLFPAIIIFLLIVSNTFKFSKTRNLVKD